jgi:hypothetical protein
MQLVEQGNTNLKKTKKIKQIKENNH